MTSNIQEDLWGSEEGCANLSLRSRIVKLVFGKPEIAQFHKWK
jgi:hypothetical protein